jgi:hypothetical protein
VSTNDGTREGLGETVVHVGGTDLTITRADLAGIRTALIEFLEQAGPEGAALVGWARGPAWIDAEGLARVGPWVVGAEGDDLFVRFRQSAGSLAMTAHRASLARNGGTWMVVRMVREHASRQR